MSDKYPNSPRLEPVHFKFTAHDAGIRLLLHIIPALQIEWLEDWMQFFVEAEEYEKAAVIKKEIDGRPPKYKYYLTEPSGTMREVKPIGDPFKDL